MTDYIVLNHVVLGSPNAPTGKTQHYAGSQAIPAASLLKIARYADEEGCYLLHFDNAGNELTDTFHESVEEAMAQAEWEYQVKSGDWRSGDASSA